MIGPCMRVAGQGHCRPETRPGRRDGCVTGAAGASDTLLRRRLRGRPVRARTDAEMIERRVRTVTRWSLRLRARRLVDPAADILYALRTVRPPLRSGRRPRRASRTGVLQQLRTLETGGLVTRSLSRHGVGRPRHVYDLTAAAQELSRQLRALRSGADGDSKVGGDQTDRGGLRGSPRDPSGEDRAPHRERLPANASLWEKVKEVATYEDETGYLGRALETRRTIPPRAQLRDLRRSAPTRSPAPPSCSSLARCLAQGHARVPHRTGGRSCTYLIEPATNASSARPARGRLTPSRQGVRAPTPLLARLPAACRLDDRAGRRPRAAEEAASKSRPRTCSS